MLLELMREFGVDGAHADDRRHHARPAARRQRRHGAIGVSYGAHEHEAFEDFETRFVAHSTAELHRWLLAHA